MEPTFNPEYHVAVSKPEFEALKAEIKEISGLPLTDTFDNDIVGMACLYLQDVPTSDSSDKVLVPKSRMAMLEAAQAYCKFLNGVRTDRVWAHHTLWQGWRKAYEASQRKGQAEPVQEMHTLETPSPEPVEGETGFPVSEPADPNPPLSFEEARALPRFWLEPPDDVISDMAGCRGRNAQGKWNASTLRDLQLCLDLGGKVYAHDPRSNGGQG